MASRGRAPCMLNEYTGIQLWQSNCEPTRKNLCCLLHCTYKISEGTNFHEFVECKKGIKILACIISEKVFTVLLLVWGLLLLKVFLSPFLNSKTHTHTHIHTYTHTHICTHIHTPPHIHAHHVYTVMYVEKTEQDRKNRDVLESLTLSFVSWSLDIWFGVIRVMCTYSICHKLFCQGNHYHHQGC